MTPPSSGPTPRRRRTARLRETPGRGPAPPRSAAPVLALAAAVALAAPAGAQQGEAPRSDERERMVREGVESPPAGLTPVEDRRVLEAMRAVPRHEFVPEPFRGRAYENRPLPIGHDQTISQPYIVARMTELLELEPGEKVLEIGTGSGYQAAVLAEITDSVFSIEIVGELARTARERLRRLGYDAVRVRHGDGWAGWPEHAPFDAVVVTAAPEDVPPPLVEQLAPGGRMVIPVGSQLYGQTLTLVRKDEDGTVTREEISGVRFVPFQRDEGGDGGG